MNNLIFIMLSLSSLYCLNKDDFQKDFINAALDRTNHDITYDGRYFNIDYPNGDIPSNLGVCTDVIIRSYRAIGVDLQKLIHEDMSQNFNDYPIKIHWPQQNSADSNIDHRRVPNLQTFFSRFGDEISITNNKETYEPGDIVTWDLKGSSPWHIGIITHHKSYITGNLLVVHNIGSGPIISDMLFKFPITGHYRYVPENYNK